MLSLPEFIREGIPEGVQLKMQMEDPRALLSLPEFVREPLPDPSPPPPPRTPLNAVSRKKSFRGLRSRSLSAPPLAWLLSSPRSSSPNTPEEKEREKETKKSRRISRAKRPGSSSGIASPITFQGWLYHHGHMVRANAPSHAAGLDIHYVAEYHETLQHILVFLNVQGMIPGANLEAEVVPTSESSTEVRSRLLLKCGTSTSPLLTLPAPVPPGAKEVKVIGPYYEMKLPVFSSPTLPAFSLDSHSALLDATELGTIMPTSFVCASCSLPLVQGSRVQEFRDLPSEHWAELVDAWMCHADQRLHEHVKQHSAQGFWPKAGEALVGGSYLLFEESAVVPSNFWPASENDHKVSPYSTFSVIYLVGWERTERRLSLATSTSGCLFSLVRCAR